MSNFEEWLWSLETQTLTDELKEDILAEVEAMLKQALLDQAIEINRKLNKKQ